MSSRPQSPRVNYKQLAQRSPSTSYLHQYDGSVACVSLRGLHPVGNPRELFSLERRTQTAKCRERAAERRRQWRPREQLACLARSADWHSKIKNPRPYSESPTRNMVVPRPPDNGSGENIAPERWVVRPRVALLNSSPMNNIDSEIAQIGSASYLLTSGIRSSPNGWEIT
ncbi:hypothetical protein DPEC_G00068140 [Dallia pectoralis]|uniref:Uncharacterized protein n=1 Tax=Dallia pectoralis TaxID=75939 RepID=A0ACC2H1V4_DALPE|nr:hypothetical protein DPEC_G00068140 [Dallia pectoralis]